MTFLAVLKIVVFTLGVISFGSLSLLWFQEAKRKSGRGVSAEGGNSCGAPGSQSSELTPVHAFLAVFSTFWFLVCLATAFASAYTPAVERLLEIAQWQLSFVWPPLILHMEYREACWYLGSPRAWKFSVVACYALALPLSVLPMAAWIGFLDLRAWFGWLTVVFIAMFVAVALACALIASRKPRREETSAERRTRFWHLLLWGLVAVAMLSILIPGRAGLGEVMSLIAPSFPLMFVFVSTYYLERFTFFDVFVKRGTFGFLTLLLLAGYFTLMSAALSRIALGWLEPWFYALTLLPLALFLPWLYRRLEEWLDRRWLGREFSPVEAVKHFLSGLQEATTEAQLTAGAETGLSDIFQARAEVVSGSAAGVSDASVAILAPIRRGGRIDGWIRLGRRRNGKPYFSKDFTLLTSLAEVLASALENVRLQERKQDQEKRERELTLHASQSELKALRAQINPHFLFNALNAIAGLIPKDPARAEETVEQLAEIFRYTLRGSEAEWARLGDELEFVRAYLEVERARFGSRLESSIEIEDSVGDIQIPTMIIQTLVENAVKHGVAAVRGVGVVSVAARRIGDRVRVEVRDNGPGFEAASETSRSRKSSGYGLKNVRSRLEGYFGDQAALEIRRDSERSTTVVSIELPATVMAFQRKTGS